MILMMIVIKSDFSIVSHCPPIDFLLDLMFLMFSALLILMMIVIKSI